GYEAEIEEFTYPWPAHSTLVMHSDGLSAGWNTEHYPGLLASHPALIAAVLDRDYNCGLDDATVVVAKGRNAFLEKQKAMNISEITILNVDGGEASLHVKSEILREAGYRVFEARTGADALRLLERQRPRLVLLGVDLPDQSGLEVCRQIKTGKAPHPKE